MTATLKGGCLCGAVTYEVADAFEYAMNCYCSKCRRATGSAFKPFAGIAIDAVNLMSGASQVETYANDAIEDIRCGTCGSVLWSVARSGTYAHVTLGTLTDAPTIRPNRHIFTGSKAPWYDILDDLPQHEGRP